MTDELKIEECPFCKGQQMVCENHPGTPWGDGDGCCGGAGMFCGCKWNDLYNGLLDENRQLKIRVDKLEYELKTAEEWNKAYKDEIRELVMGGG